MQKLPKSEALALIKNGKAGWYGVHANPPIVHKSRYIIETLDGRYYLTDQLTVTPAGLTTVNGVSKIMHKVSSEDEDVIGLLKTEVERASRNKPPKGFEEFRAGIGIPVVYGGKKNGPVP